MQKTNVQPDKKSRKGKLILIGLGLVALTGTVIYFVTRKKNNTTEVDDLLTTFESDIPERSSSSTTANQAGFPLKKGSRGDLVKRIQEMLIQKYGKDILPKYGADGHWGTELENALIAKGFPTTVDADTFTKLITIHSAPVTTKSGATSEPEFDPGYDPSTIAANILSAIFDSDFSSALVSVKKIRSGKGYAKVNDEFKRKNRTGTNKDIINALLAKFPQAASNQQLKEQFYRLGLRYDGNKWVLNGIGQILCDQIKAIQPTRVWNVKGNAITVPRETILGEFIGGRNGVTQFRTMDGKILYTNTKCICYV